MTGKVIVGRGRRGAGGAGVRGSDLAVGIGVASIAVLAVTAIVGETLAAQTFGDGSVWPTSLRVATIRLLGLVIGSPARGMSPVEAGRLPSLEALYAVVGILEAVVLTGLVFLTRWAMAWFGPVTADDGFATRDQAADALGARNLTRQRRAEIRPDLYRRGRTERSGLDDAGGDVPIS